MIVAEVGLVHVGPASEDGDLYRLAARVGDAPGEGERGESEREREPHRSNPRVNMMVRGAPAFRCRVGTRLATAEGLKLEA